MKVFEHKDQDKTGKISQFFTNDNEISTKKPFVDNRPEAVTQRRLQQTINNSPYVSQLKSFQEIVNNSPQVRKAAQLQAKINNSPRMQAERNRMERKGVGIVQKQEEQGEKDMQELPIDARMIEENCDPPKDTGKTTGANGEYKPATGVYIPAAGDNRFRVSKRFGMDMDKLPELKANIAIDLCEYSAKNTETDKQAVAKEGETTSATNDKDLVIRIAWTFDDGPHKFTPNMEKSMGNNTNATWYIQHDYYIKNRAANKKRYQEIVKNGGEIAIHSVHPTKNHANWFPGPKGHDSIQEAIKNLDYFRKILKDDEFAPKFVRVPTGLVSELAAYLKLLGEKGNSSKIARAIINGKEVSSTQAKTVKKDFEYLTKELKTRGLHLWGGSGKGKEEIGAQSWQAETSGVEGRADNSTRHHNEDRAAYLKKEGKEEYQLGVFEKRVDQIVKEKSSSSLVLLAHDTTLADAKEVAVDKKVMESYAKSKGVAIEYHTMSSLYNTIR